MKLFCTKASITLNNQYEKKQHLADHRFFVCRLL
jgi:hypothetical protein